MSDNTPSAPGAPVPPKPPEPAKVQPKKETVRISLPPKPMAAPTIKLPAISAGGPAGAAPAATGAPASRPATSASSPAPAAAGAPTSAVSRPPTSTGPAATRPPTPTPAPRPPAPTVKKLSGFDMGLAIAAAVIGLAGVGSVAFLLTIK